MLKIMKNLRQTFPNKYVGIIRLMLGVIFIMTGTMKLFLRRFWGGLVFTIN